MGMSSHGTSIPAPKGSIPANCEKVLVLEKERENSDKPRVT